MNTIKFNTIGTPKAGNAGGNGGGSASSVEYLDMRGADDQLKNLLGVLSINLNLEPTEGGLKGARMAGVTQAYVDMMFDTPFNPSWINAVSIDFTTIIKQKMGSDEMAMALKDMLPMLGVSQDQIDAIPRITEEEFYNLDNGGGGGIA